MRGGLITAAMCSGTFGDGSVIMTDTLKIIDEAPAIATVSFSDNGWKMVIKKVDNLQDNAWNHSRADSNTSIWHTYNMSSHGAFALCVYSANTLKWVAPLKYEWLLSRDNYKYGLVDDETRFWKYQQVKWGVAVGDDDDIHFVDNVFRLTNLRPMLPTSTSTSAPPGIYATYLYDEQITDYNYDGTVSGVRYNRNLTGTINYWYTNEIRSEYLPDPENFTKDFINFCDAVMAYVSK